MEDFLNLIKFKDDRLYILNPDCKNFDENSLLNILLEMHPYFVSVAPHIYSEMGSLPIIFTIKQSIELKEKYCFKKGISPSLSPSYWTYPNVDFEEVIEDISKKRDNYLKYLSLNLYNRSIN